MAEQPYITRDEFRAEIAGFHKDWAQMRTEWAEFRGEIRVEIERLRTEIQSSKNETLKWQVGLIAPLYVGVLLLIVKAFLP